MCKRKNTFSIIISGTLYSPGICWPRDTKPWKKWAITKVSQRRLDKKACRGHRFMAVSKRFKKRAKMKDQHILKLSTPKLNYKKKTIQD